MQTEVEIVPGWGAQPPRLPFDAPSRRTQKQANDEASLAAREARSLPIQNFECDAN